MAKRTFDAARTLDALLGTTGAEELTSQDQLRMIDVTHLSPTPHQPRSMFPEGSLQELADSIRENGVLQPLLVRPAGDRYEIVAGERRWRAAQLSGLRTVPAYVRDLTDDQAAAASAVENLMRENLNPIEEVEAKRRIASLALGTTEGEVLTVMRRLLDHPEGNPDGVAQLDAAFTRLGGEKWQSFLRNKARILNLPDDVKDAVRGGLDYRKAMVIGAVPMLTERARLLGLAAQGATVQTLRETLKPSTNEDEQRRRAVARALTQKQSIEHLSSKDRARVARLLTELQQLLRKGGSTANT